jgi:hypothetical protein
LAAPPAAFARGAAYNGNNVMARIGIAVLLFLLAGTGASQAQQTRQEQDTRQFVHLPAPMQEHMLGKCGIIWRP